MLTCAPCSFTHSVHARTVLVTPWKSTLCVWAHFTSMFCDACSLGMWEPCRSLRALSPVNRMCTQRVCVSSTTCIPILSLTQQCLYVTSPVVQTLAWGQLLHLVPQFTVLCESWVSGCKVVWVTVLRWCTHRLVLFVLE